MTSEVMRKERPASYWWRLRVRLWRRNTGSLLGELVRRPLALTGGVVLVLFIAMALLAPHIAPHDAVRGDLRARLTPPAWMEGGDWRYPLGTDAQGRDLLSRIIHGSRVSLAVGFMTVSISALVGTTLGAITGYFRGRVDAVISRLADLLLAFPFLIFAIGVMAFLGPGFSNLILALTFKDWVEYLRLVRGEVLVQKGQEYVEAARVSGQSEPAIITTEILPNIIQSVFVLGTLRMGHLIIMEASLSFLGLGLPARIPAWGSMVAAGRDHMLSAWWVSTIPGLAIVILVLSINLFGEGLRDILDPRLRIG